MHQASRSSPMRGQVFVVAFAVVLLSGTRSLAPLRADDTTPAEKQRKQVTAALRKGHGTWYAIQLTRAAYSDGGVRSVMVRRMVRRMPVMVKQDEYTDQRVLVPSAEYEVIEGLEPAVDAIIKHIGPPQVKTAKSRHAAAGEEPPPAPSWNFLGRYKTRDEADQHVDLARQAFEAENHWRIPDPKKGRRARLPQ